MVLSTETQWTEGIVFSGSVAQQYLFMTVLVLCVVPVVVENSVQKKKKNCIGLLWLCKGFFFFFLSFLPIPSNKKLPVLLFLFSFFSFKIDIIYYRQNFIAGRQRAGLKGHTQCWWGGTAGPGTWVKAPNLWSTAAQSGETQLALLLWLWLQCWWLWTGGWGPAEDPLISWWQQNTVTPLGFYLLGECTVCFLLSVTLFRATLCSISDL